LHTKEAQFAVILQSPVIRSSSKLLDSLAAHNTQVISVKLKSYYAGSCCGDMIASIVVDYRGETKRVNTSG